MSPRAAYMETDTTKPVPLKTGCNHTDLFAAGPPISMRGFVEFRQPLLRDVDGVVLPVVPPLEVVVDGVFFVFQAIPIVIPVSTAFLLSL